MAIRVQEIADYVKRAFGDESAVQITDQDILRWVNAAQRELASRNNVLRGVATTPITQGVFEYDISGIRINKIHSLYVNSQPIEHRSFQHAEEYILNQDPNRVSTGQPRIWWKWGNVIGLWPTPDFSSDGNFQSVPGQRVGGEGLKIYYVAAPAEISDTTGVLELPDEYFNRVVEYVMSQAYELDENNESSQLKLNQMTEGLSRMAGDHDRPQVETYPMITVLEEDMW